MSVSKNGPVARSTAASVGSSELTTQLQLQEMMDDNLEKREQLDKLAYTLDQQRGELEVLRVRAVLPDDGTERLNNAFHQVAYLKQTVQDLEQRLAAREQQNSMRMSERAVLRGKISEWALLHELPLSGREEDMRTLLLKIGERDRTIGDLEGQLQDLQGRLGERETELQALQSRETERMLNSSATSVGGMVSGSLSPRLGRSSPFMNTSDPELARRLVDSLPQRDGISRTQRDLEARLQEMKHAHNADQARWAERTAGLEERLRDMELHLSGHHLGESPAGAGSPSQKQMETLSAQIVAERAKLAHAEREIAGLRAVAATSAEEARHLRNTVAQEQANFRRHLQAMELAARKGFPADVQEIRQELLKARAHNIEYASALDTARADIKMLRDQLKNSESEKKQALLRVVELETSDPEDSSSSSEGPPRPPSGIAWPAGIGKGGPRKKASTKARSAPTGLPHSVAHSRLKAQAEEAAAERDRAKQTLAVIEAQYREALLQLDSLPRLVDENARLTRDNNRFSEEIEKLWKERDTVRRFTNTISELEFKLETSQNALKQSEVDRRAAEAALAHAATRSQDGDSDTSEDGAQSGVAKAPPDPDDAQKKRTAPRKWGPPVRTRSTPSPVHGEAPDPHAENQMLREQLQELQREHSETVRALASKVLEITQLRESVAADAPDAETDPGATDAESASERSRNTSRSGSVGSVGDDDQPPSDFSVEIEKGVRLSTSISLGTRPDRSGSRGSETREFAERMSELREQVRAQEDAMRVLEEKAARAWETVAEREAVIAAGHAEAKADYARIEALTRDAEKWQKQAAVKDAELQRLASDMDALKGTNAALYTRLMDGKQGADGAEDVAVMQLRQEKAQVEGELRAAEQTIAHLRQEASEADAKLREYARDRHDFDEMVAELQDELRVLREDAKREQGVPEVDPRTAELEREVERQRALLAAQDERLAASGQDAQRDYRQIEALREELTRVRKAAVEQEDAAHRLSEENERLKGEAARYYTHAMETKVQMSASKEAITQLVEAPPVPAPTDTPKAKPASPDAKLRSKVAELEKQLKEYERDRRDFDEAMASVEQENKRLKEKVEAAAGSSGARAADPRVAELETQLARLKDMVTKKEHELAVRDEDAAELERKTREVERLSRDITLKDEALQSMTEDFEQAKATNAKLYTQLTELKLAAKTPTKR